MWAAEDLLPDLVVLLDGPRRRAAGDRLEDEDDDFRARVAAGYRSQVAAEPERWAVVDAHGDIEATAEALAAVVADRLGLEL
jgi:thymidylate kinase